MKMKNSNKSKFESVLMEMIKDKATRYYYAYDHNNPDCDIIRIKNNNLNFSIYFLSGDNYADNKDRFSIIGSVGYKDYKATWKNLDGFINKFF
jgi:hypothetical protein